MERMAFRKIFLLSVIFLFSVLVLGQSVWACETPDYNEYECYGELDIKKVNLDYDNDLIHIFCKNFGNGAYPVVTLGDYELIVNKHNENVIVTTFPAMEAGQYKLVVSTGDARNCKDKHSVTVDHRNKPSCPPPPQHAQRDVKEIRVTKGIKVIREIPEHREYKVNKDYRGYQVRKVIKETKEKKEIPVYRDQRDQQG